MEKIKRLLRKLHIRFICVICLAIIPINVLALLVTGMMRQNYREMLLDAYQNEMDLYTEVINKDFERISLDLISEVNAEKDNIRNIMQSATQLRLAEQEFYETLNEACEEEDIVDACYFKNNDTGEVLVGYDAHQYEPEYQTIIREAVRDMVLDDRKYLFYELVEIDGQCYLLANLSFFQYSAGYLMNANDLMELIGENAQSDGRWLYLRDRAGIYEVAYGENVLRTVSEASADSSGRARRGTLLTSKIMLPGIYLEEYIPNQVLSSAVPALYRILWWAAVVVLLAIPMLWSYGRRLILAPLRTVEHAMRQIEKEQLDFRIEDMAETEEFQYLFDTYNHMAETLKNLTVEAYELELEKVRLDAINARLQVNPHMLLNSLNMIYSLALSKNFSVIQTYASNLMKYFRYILRKDQSLVTLKEELDFITDFLEVQKIRFPGAFAYVYDVEDNLYDTKMPPFIIENFVENSIKYGLKSDECIDIMVIVRKEENVLKISVVDTGNGMTEERCELLNRGEIVKDMTGSHIGVWNCRKRIRMYYGEDAVLRISSKLTEGTQIWMELPFNALRVNEEDEADEVFDGRR